MKYYVVSVFTFFVLMTSQTCLSQDTHLVARLSGNVVMNLSEYFSDAPLTANGFKMNLNREIGEQLKGLSTTTDLDLLKDLDTYVKEFSQVAKNTDNLYFHIQGAVVEYLHDFKHYIFALEDIFLDTNRIKHISAFEAKGNSKYFLKKFSGVRGEKLSNAVDKIYKVFGHESSFINKYLGSVVKPVSEKAGISYANRIITLGKSVSTLKFAPKGFNTLIKLFF